MSKNYVSVLDIGSSKLTVMIGEKGVNNTFNVRGAGEVNYAGFYEGVFLEPENLQSAIKEAISKAETNSCLTVKKLYVSVPSEFSYVETHEANVNYGKRVKIKKENIYNFLDTVSKNVDESSCSIINKSAINFILDDNRKCMNPENQYSTRLSGKISFVLADKKFLDTIYKILELLNIEQVVFVSSVLSESVYLIEPEIRDTGAVLIDCGYISSFITTVKGDGLTSLNSFSVGGGHISTDLSEVLKISFNQAESLKKKIVLSLDATDSDYYEINIDNTTQPVSAKLANEIVMARLDMIASLINKCLSQTKYEIGQYMPIYLTVGGLSYLKGAKDYLSKAIAKNIEIIAPSVPQLNRPHFSSVLGLLDFALQDTAQTKCNFKEKLKNLFRKNK